MISSQITCKCGKKSYWIVENKFTLNPCPNCGRVYIGKYNRKKLTIEAIEVRKFERIVKFLKYLVKKKADDISWFTVILCRFRKHPEGVIWENCCGLEPDMTCKKCGDDLG